MKKTLSLLLVVCLLFSMTYALSSCKGEEPPKLPNEPELLPPGTIITPTRTDYSRPLAPSPDSIEYTRPDITAVAASFKDVANKILQGADFDTGVALIKSLEEAYVTVNTMYTLSEINYMRNSLDAFWSAEYDYLTISMPTFSEALEDLFVACAKSADKERYENEYFTYSLDEYTDGGIYTDALVALLEEEAALEKRYTDISEDEITVTYQDISGTVEEILFNIERTLGKDSLAYKQAYEECNRLLYEKLASMQGDIFVELVKVRKRIADELGYESYTDFAYSEMGYDYAKEDTVALLSEFKNTVYPVYLTLYNRAFRSYFYSNKPSESSYDTTANSLYAVYTKLDGEVGEAYSYMLKCGLYDIGKYKAGRYEGAFTTYVDGAEAPFLFMTAEGYVTDSLTLAHEYGHFLDAYINGGQNPSLDLAEISSQAMELMTVPMLKGVIKPEDIRYLEYYQMYMALEALLTQGLFAAFEHNVYALEYDEISKASLNKAATDASIMIFGAEFYTSFTDMLIYHTVVYPHYVQSYCTSLIPSLEIFFKEVEAEGEGMEIYLELLNREGKDELTFEQQLISSGLSSPFDKEMLKRIANSIHYRILGSKYFTESDNANAA